MCKSANGACLLIILLLWGLVLFSCEKERKDEITKTLDLLRIDASGLAGKTIFIGHRSVGNNLIQGMKDLNKRSPGIGLNIFDLDSDITGNEGGIFHSWIMAEGSPLVIARDYIQTVEHRLKKNVNIAYLRFSPYYANEDQSDQDLNQVLKDYEEAQLFLKQRFPDTIFIHGTFPLTHVKLSLKVRIKQVMGRQDIWEYSHNLRTNEYNTALRKAYSDQKAFFDLALIQATDPEGKISVFKHQDIPYHHMVSGYTYDGVHLNQEGRIRLAGQFVTLLSELMKGQ